MGILMRRLVAVLQIAGGVFGLVPLIERASAGGTAWELVAAIIGTVLFALAIVSGAMLLERARGSVALATWVQLLQIPIIGTPWLGYGWQLGASIPATLILDTPARLGLGAHVPAWHWTLTAGSSGTSVIGLNLLALLLVLALRLTR
jgi:hypothetical protein